VKAARSSFPVSDVSVGLVEGELDVGAFVGLKDVCMRAVKVNPWYAVPLEE
jgi:hypothetical protein